MADLEDWSDHLSAEMRAVWPVLANVLSGLDGSLVGGTALAMHLRHRVSFDLDFMALRPFSGRRLVAALSEQLDDVDVSLAEDDELQATVRGVQVQVFGAPHRGDNPGHVHNIRPPTLIAGLPVASLADLLASKLDVILYRPKLRDYIDLKAIDEIGPYCLEDGFLFHMRRYGTRPWSRDLARIIDLLADPGPLEEDRAFDVERDAALAYLRGRVPALQNHLQHLRATHPDPPVERSKGREPLGPLASAGNDADPLASDPELAP